MASAALPMLFPAVKLVNSWYGDGGVRLTTPLAPAIHLGARRILAVSTRYQRSAEEAAIPQTTGYPPPAQIGGVLLNAIFLDQLDHDAYQLERLNRLIARVDDGAREGLRHVDLVVVRPSVDLGRLATEYEARLPKGFRFLTRGLGTRETKSSDLLSLLLFQGEYVRRLIDIGEEDAHRQRDAIAALVD
jgi:NTE family protein